MSNLYFNNHIKNRLFNKKKHNANKQRHFLHTLPLAGLLPNMVTMTALCLGLSSINLAMGGSFARATLYIVLACFLDGIDGRLARLLNASSVFGAELDSLADFLNFGIAPAMLVYFWLNIPHYPTRMFAWMLVMFAAVCGAIRLARFNARAITKSEETKPRILQGKFFEGIPAPCGAGLIILPIIVDFALQQDFFFTHKYIVMANTFICSFLMASSLPTFSVKKLAIKEDHAHLFLLFAGALIIGFIYKIWLTLTIMGIIYITFLPIGVIYHCYLTHKAQATDASTTDDATTAQQNTSDCIQSSSNNPEGIQHSEVQK